MAFNYVKDHKLGVTADYRYTARDESCKRKETGTRVGVSGHKILSPPTVNALSELVKEHPVSVAIEVRRDF